MYFLSSTPLILLSQQLGRSFASLVQAHSIVRTLKINIGTNKVESKKSSKKGGIDRVDRKNLINSEN